MSIADQWFEEQTGRLELMAKTPGPRFEWPDGCYGSKMAWLTFVGPSPGGTDKSPPNTKRGRILSARMDEEFWDPFKDWSHGFRNSFKPVIETVVGRSLSDGAVKLFNVVNFDWYSRPDEKDVPEETMQEGVKGVLEVLADTKPRLIIAMSNRCFDLLVENLADLVEKIEKVDLGKVEIQISSRSSHWDMDAVRLVGGHLDGGFIVRSPQHPARILNPEYAGRVANALRRAFEISAGIQPDGSGIREVATDDKLE